MKDAAHPDPFLAALGARVRASRAEAGLTRRALAARSGVSERYIAQCEAGHGNISVARLRDIAAALGRHVADLLEDPDPLAALIRDAGPDQRARALRLLGPARDPGGRIALIGLRGAGKSTLGPLAAARLGLPFRELNDTIAEAAGISVAEVFALYGEGGYRRLERAAIERLGDGPPVVLAAAGGVVSDAETFELLLTRFRTIWLKADPREHMARVRAQGDERPMAGNPTAMADLRALLAEREALYRRADHVVDTSTATLRESLDALMAALA